MITQPSNRQLIEAVCAELTDKVARRSLTER